MRKTQLVIAHVGAEENVANLVDVSGPLVAGGLGRRRGRRIGLVTGGLSLIIRGLKWRVRRGILVVFRGTVGVSIRVGCVHFVFLPRKFYRYFMKITSLPLAL